ncbi:MAG TPA: TonB-dependent receptor [Chitinophagaceae bacterium]
MKKIFSAILLLLFVSIAKAQQDSLSEQTLEEAKVYANKFVENKKNLAQKTDVITARAIANFNSQNTGDLLINTGNVFVQKSQQGGSSPVLRGFEASRVLLIVDGIRLNNAIYRAGHLQNIITIDQNMLERVEVSYGPTSTIYGSDALGGAIHFRTKSPSLATGENKLRVTGSEFLRYSSANNEKTGHADISIGGKKIAWLQSYTFSDFADMKMGDRYPGKYPDFGRRSQYIASINGKDSVVTNKDNRVQKYSGYKQWDITQKLLVKQNDKITHSLNFQFSNSSDVPRYDRLQDTRDFGGSIGTTLRYAEWYYGPQRRVMGAYELNVIKAGFVDALRININYQDIKESRQQREYRRYDRFDSRREHIKVAAFIIDAKKSWNNNEIVFGADGQLNDLKSVADRTNFSSGTISKLDTRYPDGKNRMNYFGVYAQHLLKIKNGRWVLNDGIRLQTVNLHSTIVDNSFFNFPFTEIRQDPFAVTGNLGLVYNGASDLRISGNLSSGFRAPNIDDGTKIFESSSALKRVVVPNPDIKPEYTYNIDLGISQTIKRFTYEVNTFYTLFKNVIATAPFHLSDQDSILYNGVKSAVFASQNIRKATVWGFNTRLKIELPKGFVFDNTISYTYGRYRNPNGSKTPLDHVPPVFGRSSISYNHKKFNAELFALYNGWKKIKDFNPEGEDNTQYATPDGVPTWVTINWRSSYKLTANLTLQAAVENIADRNYRYFASGFSAPGRNFVFAVRAAF